MAADDENVARPRRPSLWRVLRRTAYGKCLVCTVLLILCTVYGAYCHKHHDAYSGKHSLHIYQHGPCAQGYNFVPIVFGLLIYIVYIMECWHSRTKIIKMKKVRVHDALNYINALRSSAPIVWWKSVCYHYTRKTRQVTRYRNGDAIPTTQVYYERVNSHQSGSIFIYDMCGFKDISKRVEQLDEHRVTRVRLHRSFVFANMQSANEFEEQRARFFNDNETKDDYMEVREGMDLADCGLVDELLAFNQPHPPWYLNPVVFWCLSVLLLSWPLRIFGEWRTAILQFHVVKLFGTHYLSPSSNNYTGPLTRTSTMDTVELETLLRRQQHYVVPSYSEVMLLNNTLANAQTSYPVRQLNFIETNNEQLILQNYGACESNTNNNNNSLMRSSRSMNFDGSTPRLNPNRSLSISGLNEWSNDDTQLLVERDEPPPSYEMALRMCAPIYERLRRSISSRIASISQSSSKELKNEDAEQPNKRPK